MEEMKMYDGCIGHISNRGFTKEELIKLIEENFPNDNTFEHIAVITTVNSNKGVFQSLIFGKTIKAF